MYLNLMSNLTLTIICPVYNEAINDNKKIINYQIDEMWGLGTPEDLDNFLKNAIIS